MEEDTAVVFAHTMSSGIKGQNFLKSRDAQIQCCDLTGGGGHMSTKLQKCWEQAVGQIGE